MRRSPRVVRGQQGDNRCAGGGRGLVSLARMRANPPTASLVPPSVINVPPLTSCLAPAAPRLRPLQQVVDRAEAVGDAVLAAVADQQHVDVAERPPQWAQR